MLSQGEKPATTNNVYKLPGASLPVFTFCMQKSVADTSWQPGAVQAREFFEILFQLN